MSGIRPKGADITTIVTVHGTFANHKDDYGDKWWQKDSPFQKEVAARIGTEAGEAEWAPFHWSGQNKETDRREAGENLYRFLQDNFEAKNQAYFLVGHSHGGSVIAEALRYSARHDDRLENLKSWITVATPFLAFAKQKRLFQRLTRRYQLLLAIAIAYCLAIFLAIPFGMCDSDMGYGNTCWVRKSGPQHFNFVDISQVEQAGSGEVGDPASLDSPDDLTAHFKTLARFDFDRQSFLTLEPGSGAADWTSRLGLNQPGLQDFRVTLSNGQSHIYRTQVQDLNRMQLIQFVPRSTVLWSKGFFMYLLFTMIPLVIAGYLLWRSQKHLRRRYSSQYETRFTEWYRDRWLKLSHPEDEAINAISASTITKINIAPADMLQGFFVLTFSSVFAIILIFTGAKLSSVIMPWRQRGFDGELLATLGSAINKSNDIFDGGNSFVGDRSPLTTLFFNNDGSLSAMSLLLTLAALTIIAVFVGRLIEKYILNPVLKTSVDSVVQSSAAGEAFGNNALGEASLSCAAHPWEFEDTHKGAFPEKAGQAIIAHANKDVTRLANKLRSALHQSVSDPGGFSAADMMGEDMDEILIHTSYFGVKEFHDLFAAALVTSGDFRPKPAFKSHKTAAKWVKAL